LYGRKGEEKEGREEREGKGKFDLRSFADKICEFGCHPGSSFLATETVSIC
jgi:hypothetical protein